jgi:hypothetical protein
MKKYLVVPTQGSSYTVEATAIDFNTNARLIYLRGAASELVAILCAENIVSVSEHEKTKDV